MAVDELVIVVHPPANPIDPGSEVLRADVERRLGQSLPRDIYDYVSRYGTGIFSDTLTIHNPFSPDYFEVLSEVSKCYQDLKEAEGDAVIPYKIYPASPGLLVCASEVNGGMLFWLTEGAPDEWPLILMTVDFQFERRNMSLTTFLAQVFNGQTGCVLWNLEWAQHNLVGVAFHQT